MRRLLALQLIPALIATSSAGAFLHTHAYTDHQHPEHHHGLQAHEHYAMPTHPDDGIAHVEECDAGKHAVAIKSVCAAAPPPPVVLAALSLPGLLIADLQASRAVGYADVRVHGPPLRTHTSPRAPPLIAHA